MSTKQQRQSRGQKQTDREVFYALSTLNLLDGTRIKTIIPPSRKLMFFFFNLCVCLPVSRRNHNSRSGRRILIVGVKCAGQGHFCQTSNCFRRFEKLVLPSIFDASLSSLTM